MIWPSKMFFADMDTIRIVSQIRENKSGRWTSFQSAFGAFRWFKITKHFDQVGRCLSIFLSSFPIKIQSRQLRRLRRESSGEQTARGFQLLGDSSFIRKCHRHTATLTFIRTAKENVTDTAAMYYRHRDTATDSLSIAITITGENITHWSTFRCLSSQQAKPCPPVE